MLGRLLPQEGVQATVFEAKSTILNLYAGEDDETSTKAAMSRVDPKLAECFMEMDTCRSAPGMDVLDDSTFGGLLVLA